MKKEKEIWDEVEKTMRSLDDIKQAKTDTFFYSRLENSLERRTERQVSGPAVWAAAAVMLLILVNIYTVSIFNSETSEEGIDLFMETYVLSVPDLYETETEVIE